MYQYVSVCIILYLMVYLSVSYHICMYLVLCSTLRRKFVSWYMNVSVCIMYVSVWLTLTNRDWLLIPWLDLESHAPFFHPYMWVMSCNKHILSSVHLSEDRCFSATLPWPSDGGALMQQAMLSVFIIRTRPWRRRRIKRNKRVICCRMMCAHLEDTYWYWQIHIDIYRCNRYNRYIQIHTDIGIFFFGQICTVLSVCISDVSCMYLDRYIQIHTDTEIHTR